MAENTAGGVLTPKETQEIQDFFKKKNIDIQANLQPQKIRRMEDGGMVIDPPVFTLQFVRIQNQEKAVNGETKIDIN